MILFHGIEQSSFNRVTNYNRHIFTHNYSQKCSDTGNFLWISRKLGETDGYMYRKKLLKMSISITYLNIIEIREDGTVLQVHLKFLISKNLATKVCQCKLVGRLIPETNSIALIRLVLVTSATVADRNSWQRKRRATSVTLLGKGVTVRKISGDERLMQVERGPRARQPATNCPKNAVPAFLPATGSRSEFDAGRNWPRRKLTCPTHVIKEHATAPVVAAFPTDRIRGK